MKKNLKVHYVSGSRADLGLMVDCLTALEKDDIEISVVVTGQHLIRKYGDTKRDINSAG